MDTLLTSSPPLPHTPNSPEQRLGMGLGRPWVPFRSRRIISFPKSKCYRETREPGQLLLPSDPALRLCSLKADQKGKERGEGVGEREGQERKEGRRRERGGLENSLEEGARHQEAKVMVKAGLQSEKLFLG